MTKHEAQRNYSIAVDFDGVIHSYTSKWTIAEEILDPPVPGAIEWLNKMDKKFRVIIFTTRGATFAGEQAVREWLVAHGFEAAHRVGPTNNPSVEDYEVVITAQKPPALIYLDDRAVRFDGTNFPTVEQIHHDLVPWNKNPPMTGLWRFELYETWRGEWGWQFVSDQGHVLARSTDMFPLEETARLALKGIQPRMASATLRGRNDD